MAAGRDGPVGRRGRRHRGHRPRFHEGGGMRARSREGDPTQGIGLVEPHVVSFAGPGTRLERHGGRRREEGEAVRRRRQRARPRREHGRGCDGAESAAAGRSPAPEGRRRPGRGWRAFRSRRSGRRRPGSTARSTTRRPVSADVPCLAKAAPAKGRRATMRPRAASAASRAGSSRARDGTMAARRPPSARQS